LKERPWFFLGEKLKSYNANVMINFHGRKASFQEIQRHKLVSLLMKHLQSESFDEEDFLRKEDQKKEVYFHDDHNLSTQKPIRN
jgi:hypothetical protein